MRFNSVTPVFGMRGTGKTLYELGSKYSSSKGDENLNITGKIEIALQSKKKVLIIDTLDHPAYKKIPILLQKDATKFNQGVGRIICYPDDMVKLVSYINKQSNYNNTFIVFEDAGKYTEKTLPRAFKQLIADTKQRNIDIDFLYHAWSDAPNDIFRKGIDFIQIFKTQDSPLTKKNFIRDFDLVWDSYKKVKDNPIRFYSVSLDVRTN